LWHKAFKNSRYTEGYAGEFLKTFYQQHLSTPHPQKSLNSGLINILSIFFGTLIINFPYALDRIIKKKPGIVNLFWIFFVYFLIFRVLSHGENKNDYNKKFLRGGPGGWFL
jgi:hypothetical protein